MHNNPDFDLRLVSVKVSIYNHERQAYSAINNSSLLIIKITKLTYKWDLQSIIIFVLRNLNRAKFWDNCKDFIKRVVLQFGFLWFTSNRIIQLVIKPAVFCKKLGITTNNEETIFTELDGIVPETVLN